jgi:hypothetical protein
VDSRSAWRWALEVLAEHSILINPTLTSRDLAADDAPRVMSMEYSVAIADVGSLTELLYLRHLGTPHAARRPLPSAFRHAKPGVLPYRDGVDILFSTDDYGGDDDDVMTSSAKDAGRRDNARIIQCGVLGCTESFAVKFARQHASWHIAHDQDLERKVGVPVALLCGQCAAYPATQYAVDGASGPGCSVWLTKHGKSQKPHTLCKIVGQVDFSLGAAATSTTTMPSTNIPLQCPLCPTRPMPQFFWAVGGMGAHWNRAHASTVMPVALKKATEVSSAQLQRLKSFSVARAPRAAPKRPQRRRKRANQSLKSGAPRPAVEPWKPRATDGMPTRVILLALT